MFNALGRSDRPSTREAPHTSVLTLLFEKYSNEVTPTSMALRDIGEGFPGAAIPSTGRKWEFPDC